MLDCQQVEDHLTDIPGGTLRGPCRGDVADHLRGCDHCLYYAARAQSTRRLAARTPVETLSPVARDAVLDAYRRWATGRRAGRY